MCPRIQVRCTKNGQHSTVTKLWKSLITSGKHRPTLASEWSRAVTVGSCVPEASGFCVGRPVPEASKRTPSPGAGGTDLLSGWPRRSNGVSWLRPFLLEQGLYPLERRVLEALREDAQLGSSKPRHRGSLSCVTLYQNLIHVRRHFKNLT